MWIEKHGPGYRIRDLVGSKKVTVRSGFATKTAAKNALTTLRADRLRGDELVPRGGKVLLRDWVGLWRPSWEASLKSSAHHSETSRLDNHVLPLLGHAALGDIDALVVQAWVNDLAAGRGPDVGRRRRRQLSPKTVRNCHGLLFTILEAATAPTYRLIRSNPCRSTNLPKWERREMRFLTDPEIARLITAVPAHWRPLVLLLVGTGLRWGEAVGLRIGDVDLLARVPYVRVVRALHEKPSSAEIVFTSPKTRQSRRTVSVSGAVVDALVPLWTGRDREQLLFTAPQGGAVRTRNFRRTWLKAVVRAGLDGLRIHDLRHTHAALLISAGKSLTAIQRRLGHSSIAVTSDLYGHLREEVDDGILAAIEEALAGVDMSSAAGEVAEEMKDVLA